MFSLIQNQKAALPDSEASCTRRENRIGKVTISLLKTSNQCSLDITDHREQGNL
jgi:hypothetical protein